MLADDVQNSYQFSHQYQSVERRATLLTVEKPIVSLTITPATPRVHPVFELQGAPRTLSRVELDGRILAASEYAWDGQTFWLNATLARNTLLRLAFPNCPPPISYSFKEPSKLKP